MNRQGSARSTRCSRQDYRARCFGRKGPSSGMGERCVVAEMRVGNRARLVMPTSRVMENGVMLGAEILGTAWWTGPPASGAFQ
jgi:hypothetical protein